MNEETKYWMDRFAEAERAFHELKALTKKLPVGKWTDEYRELAEKIHTLGREIFWVGKTNG